MTNNNSETNAVENNDISLKTGNKDFTLSLNPEADSLREFTNLKRHRENLLSGYVMVNWEKIQEIFEKEGLIAVNAIMGPSQTIEEAIFSIIFTGRFIESSGMLLSSVGIFTRDKLKNDDAEEEIPELIREGKFKISKDDIQDRFMDEMEAAVEGKEISYNNFPEIFRILSICITNPQEAIAVAINIMVNYFIVSGYMKNPPIPE